MTRSRRLRAWPLVVLAGLIVWVVVTALAGIPRAGRRRPSAPTAGRIEGTHIQGGRNVSAGPGGVARAFAIAYARYLDRRTGVRALIQASTEVQRIATSAGRAPAELRRGELLLTGVVAAAPSAPGVETFRLIMRRGTDSFPAQVTLLEQDGRWQVVDLVPPDFATDLARSAPQARSSQMSAPVGVRAAAHTFLAGYLRFSYGQFPAQRLADVTTALRRRLASQPPRVPPRIAALRPAIRWLSFAPEKHNGWLAMAGVTDTRNNYLVSCQLAYGGGGWQVTSIGPS